MLTFIATAILFCLIAAAMAVGVIFSNRSLRGSCGGAGAGAGDDCSCDAAKRKACALEKAREAQASAS